MKMASISTVVICLMPAILFTCPSWAMSKQDCQTVCKNDGRCLEKESGSNQYHCECAFPMSGTNCTEIDEDGPYYCFQNGSVVLCIFIEDLGTYDAVKNFCQNMNMSMVVIPDKKTDESVKWIMRKNLSKEFGACHFIGLRRDPKANDNFTWVDGSPLGSYSNMSITEGQSLDCVCLNAVDNFNWINNDCNNSRHTEPDDYTLCARHCEP